MVNVDGFHMVQSSMLNVGSRQPALVAALLVISLSAVANAYLPPAAALMRTPSQVNWRK
jgi:hypothetical protein